MSGPQGGVGNINGMQTGNAGETAAARLYDRRRLRPQLAHAPAISDADRDTARAVLREIESGAWRDQDTIDAIKSAE